MILQLLHVFYSDNKMNKLFNLCGWKAANAWGNTALPGTNTRLFYGICSRKWIWRIKEPHDSWCKQDLEALERKNTAAHRLSVPFHNSLQECWEGSIFQRFFSQINSNPEEKTSTLQSCQENSLMSPTSFQLRPSIFCSELRWYVSEMSFIF